MNVTINLNNEGLESIFRPYQINIMQYLWETDKPKGSNDVWNGIGSGSISRASVINSLNWMSDIGFLEKTETTGKGGHRGLYQPLLNEVEILEMVYLKASEKLMQGES